MKDNERHLELLGGVELFRGLSKKDLGILAGHMKEAGYPDGAAVVTEDGREGRFHLIVEGTACVMAGDQLVDRLKPGDYFGEISLIDKEPPSATVLADGGLRTLSLASFNFRPVLREHPDIAYALLLQLCRLFRRERSLRP